jgi:hypothetical protein
MALETDISIDGDVAAVLSLDKQIQFAAAATATATAVESQQAAIEAIQDTFTPRNPWYLPQNRFGVHYTAATPANPTAQVHTNAWWLKDHETGALRSPHDGPLLAVPTDAIWTNRQRQIPQNERPRNLQDAFILKTTHGPKIFRRINQKLEVVYNLVTKVRIRKQSTIVQPTIDTTQKRFPQIFAEKLLEAFKTAK